MIPPHLFYQIYLSFPEQNDSTPPKCGELSEYTDSAHTEVEFWEYRASVTQRVLKYDANAAQKGLLFTKTFAMRARYGSEAVHSNNRTSRARYCVCNGDSLIQSS